MVIMDWLWISIMISACFIGKGISEQDDDDDDENYIYENQDMDVKQGWTEHLDCALPDLYCSITHYLLSKGDASGETPEEQRVACSQLCLETEDCEYFTVYSARGRTECYLQSDCLKIMEDGCLEEGKCFSKHTDCFNITASISCPTPPDLGPEFLKWQCTGSDENVLDLSLPNITMPFGTICYLSCPSWVTNGLLPGYLESHCDEYGEWTDSRVHNGDLCLRFPEVSYPKPDAGIHSPDPSPLTCSCPPIHLRWPPTVPNGFYYDPTLENGLELICDAPINSVPGKMVIDADNECKLLCSGFQVAHIRCVNGIWSGNPERGFWCHNPPRPAGCLLSGANIDHGESVKCGASQFKCNNGELMRSEVIYIIDETGSMDNDIGEGENEISKEVIWKNTAVDLLSNLSVCQLGLQTYTLMTFTSYIDNVTLTSNQTEFEHLVLDVDPYGEGDEWIYAVLKDALSQASKNSLIFVFSDEEAEDMDNCTLKSEIISLRDATYSTIKFMVIPDSNREWGQMTESFQDIGSVYDIHKHKCY